MKQIKPNNEILGCWNCYVSAGKDKEDRNKRLNEAPERLRGDIKRHVQTVFDLRRRK